MFGHACQLKADYNPRLLMSATGSLGSLLERYAGIRSAVNAIRTRLIDLLTGPSNQALRAHSTFYTRV